MIARTFPPMFLLGPSGAGKSDAGRQIVALCESYGVESKFVTSKEVLGAIVLEDARKWGIRFNGQVHTRHLTLKNPAEADETNFQAEFHDGWALNRAHEGLIASVARRWRETKGGVFLVAELANGPEIPWGFFREPTRQTGTQFVNWIGQQGLLDNALAWYFTAPFALRAERNRGRRGYIPDAEFAKLYPDSNDFTSADAARFADGRYHFINNEFPTEEAFLEQVEQDCRSILLPRLGLEGQNSRPEGPSGFSPGGEHEHG